MSGTFAAATPFTHPGPTGPSGMSPFTPQGLNINPFALQQLFGQPFGGIGSGLTPGNPSVAQPLHQVVQLLQAIPQQLQQLEYLQFQQLQQLQQVQQLVQLIPAQLQQLVQFGSRQTQQSTPLQQPFGQIPGLGSSISPWGIQPQVLGAQPGHVM